MDYSNLIPQELCHDCQITTKDDLLQLGRESILFLSDYWRNISIERMGKSIGNGDFDETLMHADERLENQKKAEKLAELSAYAESKVHIFRTVPYEKGDLVTCFVEDGSSGRIIDAVIMDVRFNFHAARIIYDIRPRKRHTPWNRHAESAETSYSICHSNVSVIPTEDIPYLKANPFFFKRYLDLRAATDTDRERIPHILSLILKKMPPV